MIMWEPGDSEEVERLSLKWRLTLFACMCFLGGWFVIWLVGLVIDGVLKVLGR
jgi:hypothetical protein